MDKTKNKLSFHGDGGELFITYLVNGLLTVITLGIYRFWAKVKVTKFLYKYTEFMGERFDYHGTGKELLQGFLKAMGFFIVFLLMAIGINRLLSKLYSEEIGIIAAYLFAYVLIIIFVPFIMVGRQRYRLSRSSWRNIRFKFSGTAKEFFFLYIKGVLLSIVTLGFYGPWFRCNIYKYFAEHSQYGNQRFSYSGKGIELFKIYLKGILLSIITLGIYFFWFSAELTRYYWDNMSFQDNKFSSEITGGRIFVTALKSMLLIVFSFGIGFPWAFIWNLRLTLGTISYDGDIDLKQIKADLDKSASSLADGIAEATGAFDFTS
ncbi:MAG: YjgN family protein [Spirochaetota bacterium]